MTDNPETLYSYIRDNLDESASDDDWLVRLTLAHISRLNKRDRDAFLYEAVQNVVTNLRRGHVRSVEVRTIGDRTERVAPPSKVKELLDERIWVPKEGYILWGDATAEQHRSRAEYLRGLAYSTCVTAARHEEAADTIETQGITCLREQVAA